MCSGPSKNISQNFESSPITRKPLITQILERWLLVGKKVPYKFPNDIASKLLTLHDLSVGRKMANYSNSHSSDTRPIKKKYGIRDYIWLHICANLWVKIPKFRGGSKNWTKIWKNGTFRLEALPDASKVLHHPKMVPPYSLGTCPPKTLEHFDARHSFIKKKLIFWRPLILAKVLKWSWSCQNLTYVKFDQKGF